MASNLQPRIRTEGDGRVIAVVGERYTYLASGVDTGNAFALLHADIPPGDPGPPPHTHTREDESFYILEGQLTFNIAGEDIVAPRGAFVFAPRGIRHTFRNTGNGPARVLITIAPAGLEQMFVEVGADWTGRTDHPGPPAQDEIQRLLATAPKYGLEIHAPPPD